MGEIDNEAVERVLASMRSWPDGSAQVATARRDAIGGWGVSCVLEAVARDASLFRAVELRRAEILRDQGFPGGKAGA